MSDKATNVFMLFFFGLFVAAFVQCAMTLIDIRNKLIDMGSDVYSISIMTGVIRDKLESNCEEEVK
jgi:hypothetical protein